MFGSMLVVDINRAVFGDVLRQKRNESPASNMRRGIEAPQLPDAEARKHGLRFEFRIVYADGGRHVAINDLIAKAELPLRELARVGAAVPGAAMLREFFDGPRRAVALDIVRRGAHDQLNRHQPAGDRATRRRRSAAKSHVGAVCHEIRELIVELHFELHVLIALLEFLEVRPEDREPECPWRTHAQHAGHVLFRAPGLVERGREGGERRLHVVEQPLALLGQAQLARGPVKEPHAQFLLQLHHRVARGLGRDALIDCRPTQAAERRGTDENGDRTNSVHLQGPDSQTEVDYPSSNIRLVCVNRRDYHDFTSSHTQERHDG
ncbi:hypothetical protein PUN4_570096 [Paraburkholderia unamae]|nr:hypothetical protein PUN4_570096 [Paraburkholderia unamae]